MKGLENIGRCERESRSLRAIGCRWNQVESGMNVGARNAELIVSAEFILVKMAVNCWAFPELGNSYNNEVIQQMFGNAVGAGREEQQLLRLVNISGNGFLGILKFGKLRKKRYILY